MASGKQAAEPLFYWDIVNGIPDRDARMMRRGSGGGVLRQQGKENEMRKVMRVFVGAMLLTGLSATAIADGRGDRAAKGDAISLHLASSTPQAGFRQVTTTTGDRMYIAARATWTSLDILSVDTLPGRSGSTLSMRLSGSATNRLNDQVSRVSDTQVAVYSGKSVIAMASVNKDGTLTISNITPERGDDIRRVVDSDPIAPVGPLVTVVAAGELNGQHLIDVYIEGVDSLRGYQIRLTTGGGDSGSLNLEQVKVNENREDFVFYGSSVIDASTPLLGQLASVRSEGPTTATQASYLGTYAYTPTRDASGLFRVNVEIGANSVLVGSQTQEMGFNVGADARIFVGSTEKDSRDTK